MEAAMKKFKVITVVLTALAVVSAGFMVMSVVLKMHAGGGVDTSDFRMEESAYSKAVKSSGQISFPVMQTDFRDVFYLADPSGKVQFLQYNDGKLEKYAGEVKTVKVSVKCSNENIPAVVYYIKRDKKITGCGLYTNKISKADVKIHEYAFFKLTDMPAGYDRSGALLLVDFEKDNFADSEKIYTEAFSVSLSSGETERIASNNGRTVDNKGAMREDWAMLTDDFLNTARKAPLFLSGRNYNLDETGYKTDIIKLHGTRKPSVEVRNMIGFWAKLTDYGYAFLRSTKGGFQCVLNKDGKENAYKTLKGDFYSHYLQDGDYIFNKDTKTFTQLLSGKDKAFSDIVFAAAPQTLSVNPGGKRAVLASNGTANPKGANIQKLVICNLETGTQVSYEEPYIYSSEYSNFFWIDDSTLLHVRPLNDDGTKLQYVVLNIE